METYRSSLENCIDVTNLCEECGEVIECADWAAMINTELKPGTDEKYLVVSAVKRRRIDGAEADLAKYTYLAHPFARNNGLRLLDDMNLQKILSVQSLTSDIAIDMKEKRNAIPRPKDMGRSEFIEEE